MKLSLPNFSTARVLVVGDIMLDKYWHGQTSRLSPEAPVPIVHIKEQQERAGGAGNVALNISALGGQATLIGITGQDDAAKQIKNTLNTHNVKCFFTELADLPTITKLRVLSRNQQLIRLDFEEGLHTAYDAPSLLSCIEQQLATTDVVVLSDYGKGTLNDPQAIIHLARAANKPILIDPKGNDFTKYRGATLITPNLSEFEAIVGHCADEASLVEKGQRLRDELDLTALLITRSEQGMTLLQRDCSPLHLPTNAQEVFDVTGAGDTVIGVLATVLAAQENLEQATTLANYAAGISVAKLGAATVSPSELEMVLHTLHCPTGIQKSLENLVNIVRTAQRNGEKIVMTNGCFDILHAGHIYSLTQARQLGDRLIVALNDDASIKRLKGEQRPVNCLEHRAIMLNALEMVDWVIPFSSDTPAELISAILPDILAKGGDYQVEDIAGGDSVLKNGGQVLILDSIENISTTHIINTLLTSSQVKE